MTASHMLHCACGHARIKEQGSPIDSVECLCGSCQKAGERMRRLDGATDVLTSYGATPVVLYRKDKISFVAGADRLKAFRLSPTASTHRIIATCCNTPAFLEFKGSHWLSLYAGFWPDGSRPPARLRTMAADMVDQAALPDDIPHLQKHSLNFFARLFGAWVAMGFRSPKMPETGEIDA